MGKIFTIVYGSSLNPGRLAMASIRAETGEEAYQKSLTIIKQQYGDLMWHPLITNIFDPALDDVKSEETIDETKATKNWVLNTIVTSQDKVLFEAAKPYLSEPEVKFISEKLSV